MASSSSSKKIHADTTDKELTEQEEELEHFDDFTLASSWERFISKIEAVLRVWMSDGPKNLLEKGAVLLEDAGNLYKVKSEMKYAMKSYCMEFYFMTDPDGKLADWNFDLHDLQLCFGVKEFLVIAPQSASGVILDAPESSKLLSAIAIALSNCSRPTPHWIYLFIISKSDLTFRTLPYDDDNMKDAKISKSGENLTGPMCNGTQWDDDCSWSEWYSAEDPVKGFELIAIWSEKMVESSMEMAELENASPHEAEKWLISLRLEGSSGNRVGFASELCLLVDALQVSFEAQFMEDFVSAVENPGSDNLKSMVIPPPTVRDRVLKELFIEEGLYQRKRVREREDVREGEWTTVRKRGRGNLRVVSTERKDPRQSYGGARQRQYANQVYPNWRNRADITSFYFTRFPEEVHEAELWNHFKKWEDVREIFVSKQRNKEGRRYGFVRFKGVDDVSRLERQLDNTIIGGLKLHVNIPKYARGKLEKGESNNRWQGTNQKQKEGMKTIATTAAHTTVPTRTYAVILATRSGNAGQHRNKVTTQARHGGSHSSIQLDIPKEEDKWYKNAWVGRLRKPEIFERLEDELTWILGSDVTPKYLGDDMVILPGLQDAKAEELIKEEIDNGASLFYSLEKWKPEMRLGNRLVWMHCWGILLAAWGIEHIRKIIVAVGELVDVDDEVEELRRLDRARVLIRTPWCPTIHHSVTVDIHGKSHLVFMVEETSRSEDPFARQRRHSLRSSDDISSHQPHD
ncbi:Rab3 GTPase-activating protein catalytic subunit [Glycine max]|nr:Rab3 GTPase-activating protein catalytic subunit [Glycine max]